MDGIGDASALRKTLKLAYKRIIIDNYHNGGAFAPPFCSYKYCGYISRNMNKELYAQIKSLKNKWKQYPNEYNPADPNNRQILIEKNLRLAVDIALKYRGLGLTEDELISAALLGLCTAYEKYNPNKAELKQRLLSQINQTTTQEEFCVLLQKETDYNQENFHCLQNVPNNYEEMVKWIEKNIRPAKFTSVASMWIKAFVLSELDKHGTPLRVGENYKVDNQFEYIDNPECKAITNLRIEGSDEETMEREAKFELLYDGINEDCQRVLNLRYGIGCGHPFTIVEIAAEMETSVEDIKSALRLTENQMRYNIVRYGLNLADFLV